VCLPARSRANVVAHPADPVPPSGPALHGYLVGEWHAVRVSRVPLRQALADVPPYVPGARVPVGAAAYKLSSNENPFPPLPSVLMAISDAAADVNRYPDMYATELLAEAAALRKVTFRLRTLAHSNLKVSGMGSKATTRPVSPTMSDMRSV